MSYPHAIWNPADLNPYERAPAPQKTSMTLALPGGVRRVVPATPGFTGREAFASWDTEQVLV